MRARVVFWVLVIGEGVVYVGGWVLEAVKSRRSRGAEQGMNLGSVGDGRGQQWAVEEPWKETR